MLQPDILIEDDCKSIGGAWQMCITKVNLDIKKNILYIVVPEFQGIDNLSEEINVFHDNNNQDAKRDVSLSSKVA